MPGVTAEARADVAEAMVRTAFATGSDLLGKSVDEAPIDIGHLRESAELALVVNTTTFAGEGMLDQAIAYARALALGGALRSVAFEVSFHTVYAHAQHEGHAIMHRGTRVWHWVARNHPKGGKSKYLSDPLYANAPRYVRLMQRAVDAVGGTSGKAALQRLRGQQGA